MKQIICQLTDRLKCFFNLETLSQTILAESHTKNQLSSVNLWIKSGNLNVSTFYYNMYKQSASKLKTKGVIYKMIYTYTKIIQALVNILFGKTMQNIKIAS